MIKPILENEKGFSLVEALISVLLVSILAMGVAGMITAFARFTGHDSVTTCLLQAASSGIEAKRVNPALNSMQVACGSLTINVSISGNPPSTPPPMGSGQSACAEVTATATVIGRTMVMRDWVCNFPQG